MKNWIASRLNDDARTWRKLWSMWTAIFWSIVGSFIMVAPLVSDEAKALIGPWQFGGILSDQFVIPVPAHMRRGCGMGGRNRPFSSAPSGPVSSVSGVTGASPKCRPGGATCSSLSKMKGESVARYSSISRWVSVSARVTGAALRGTMSVEGPGQRVAVVMTEPTGEERGRPKAVVKPATGCDKTVGTGLAHADLV